MTKMKTHTHQLGQGLKITVERPYTMQDAVDEFKADIKKLGGKVTQVQDELSVSDLSAAAYGTAMHKLTENLKSLGGVVAAAPATDYSDLEARVLAHLIDAGTFGRPFFGYPTVGSVSGRMTGSKSNLSEVARAHAPTPKVKKVADVAPQALSTWEFSQEYLDRVYGTKVHVVGQHFRPKRAQNVIGYKKMGNMALLVAEPDNPVDLNAIMVLMWEDETKSWQHVGYVRATEAALLRSKWTGDFKRPMVSRITQRPVNADGHRGGRNIELTLTGEVRTYPGYVL